MSTNPEKPSAPSSISENSAARRETFTRDQIRKAFDDHFWGSGEWWFGDAPQIGSSRDTPEKRAELDRLIEGDFEAFVAALERTCACNPADRTGGGHARDCPEYDPRADVEALGPNP